MKWVLLKGSASRSSSVSSPIYDLSAHSNPETTHLHNPSLHTTNTQLLKPVVSLFKVNFKPSSKWRLHAQITRPSKGSCFSWSPQFSPFCLGYQLWELPNVNQLSTSSQYLVSNHDTFCFEPLPCRLPTRRLVNRVESSVLFNGTWQANLLMCVEPPWGVLI